MIGAGLVLGFAPGLILGDMQIRQPERDPAYDPSTRLEKCKIAQMGDSMIPVFS